MRHASHQPASQRRELTERRGRGWRAASELRKGAGHAECSLRGVREGRRGLGPGQGGWQAVRTHVGVKLPHILMR
jgi:hypothetical protein